MLSNATLQNVLSFIPILDLSRVIIVVILLRIRTFQLSTPSPGSLAKTSDSSSEVTSSSVLMYLALFGDCSLIIDLLILGRRNVVSLYAFVYPCASHN